MSRPLILMLLLILAACDGTGDKPDGATLRVDALGSIDSPTSGNTGTSPPRQWLLAARHQGLLQFDSAGSPVPGLATSWRVADDGRSIIFRLRAAKWSDGRPLKASEVVLSLRRIFAPDSRNPLKPLLGAIENAAAVSAGRAQATALGISAPVDNIIEIRLSAPAPELLQLLALPEAVIQRGGTNPATIGPFELVDIKARPLRFDRNHDFHSLGSVPLARIVLTPATDPVAAIARFTRGDADIVTGGTLVGFGEARTLTRPAALHVETGWGVYGYRANVAVGPLADARVRRALAMAIDRDALLARPFAAHDQSPVTGLGAGDALAADWAALPLAARQAEARALLAAAGYSTAHPLTLPVSLPDAHEHVAVLTAVAADWAAIGVTTSIITRSSAAHASVVARGDFILAQIDQVPPFDGATARLLPFTCSAAIGSYCNRDADTALRTAQTAATAADRATALVDAESRIVADTPVIALFTPVRWSLLAPGVSGWTDNVGGRHNPARLDMIGKGGKGR